MARALLPGAALRETNQGTGHAVYHSKRGRCSPRLPASASSCLSPQLSSRRWEAGEQSRLLTLQRVTDGKVMTAMRLT